MYAGIHAGLKIGIEECVDTGIDAGMESCTDAGKDAGIDFLISKY